MTSRWIFGISLAGTLAGGTALAWAQGAKPAAAPSAPPTAEQTRFFESRIRPVLAQNCAGCHGAGLQRGGLRLDTKAGFLKGGDSGPLFSGNDPEKSLLVHAVRQDRGVKMPPQGKLQPGQIEDLTAWVKMGAPWGFESGSTPATEDPKSYWAFQPVRAQKTPVVRNKTWGKNPIDAFVLAKLEAKGLAPSGPAPKRELIRRATYDLTGLPPSAEDVDRFVADGAPDAYEKLIDRLLVSQQYGERWGRHWLDVVRFGQTNGYERDDEKPEAWRYRDYVIKSFNDDKPFDQFIREQLAGDELEHPTDETLTATGFYRIGVWDDEPDDLKQAEFDNLDDVLATFGQAFLGLTVGCARCHDHKFDPIPTKDYYGMLAFIRGVKRYTVPDEKNPEKNTIFQPLSNGQKTLAVQENDPSAMPKTFVLTRGSAATPAAEVQPHFLSALCSSPDAVEPKLPAPAAGAKTSGRRTILADWIASTNNPMTARVIANRLWQHHFGRGIVPTPNDFGKTGTPPTHPELLDYLAGEVVKGGWRLKRIQKLIMLSAAYQQSSRATNPQALTKDPGNTLLWRQNMHRLEAESIRDSILSTSGKLNLKMGGRGIFPVLPPEVLSTQSRPGNGWGKSDEEERGRRSVYIFVKRTLGVPILETFDVGSPDSPVAQRATTTIAPQALILLNSAFMDEQSAAFAARLQKEAGADTDALIRRAFRDAIQRDPTAKELQIGRDYLARQRQACSAMPPTEAESTALARFCKVVLNLNEFVYVD